MTPLRDTSTVAGRRRLLHLAGALLALGPLCVRAQPEAAGVVATFSILADIAREIAPEGVATSALVGPDADAHVYEPTPADSRRLARAGLVVVNGLGFEGWLDRLIKVSGYKGTVVVASEGIVPLRATGAHAHHKGGAAVDPHAWQDLANTRRYVANLVRAMSRRWPVHEAEIATRGADYLARVDRLDAALRQYVERVPRAERRVITSHDAFGYLGRAYGIDFLAPQGWTTHSEPSAAAVGRLIRQIRQQNVKAVFVENISDRRLIERIATDAGARVGGTLYSDALSAAGGPADTYLRLFEHNVRSIVDTLAGKR